jgi:hypothetical protein
MVRWARRIGGLSLIPFLFYSASCGQEAQIRSSQENYGNLGRTAVAPSRQGELISDLAPAETRMLDVTANVPKAEEFTANSFDVIAAQDPLLSQLPFFCDPRRNAPNVIQNSSACDRFRPIPYIGFGMDHEPDIANLLKRPVRSFRDDDDEGNNNYDVAWDPLLR